MSSSRVFETPKTTVTGHQLSLSVIGNIENELVNVISIVLLYCDIDWGLCYSGILMF